jgi:type II secretory pathway pseudopilin PulG
MSAETVDRGIPIPRVAAALCVIALLALVLPYTAVRTMHARRLDAADRQMQAIGDALGRILAGDPTAIPAGADVLAGPGQLPWAADPAWRTAASIPLARLVPGSAGDRPDPWGNAYLVSVAALRDGRGRVLSAGPDGKLETPFAAGTTGLTGDDRAVTVSAPGTKR